MNTFKDVLFRAVTGFDVSTKTLSAATYEYIEDKLSQCDQSLNAVVKETHEIIQSEWGVPRGRTTLHNYYQTCAWLIAETGGIEWVDGRTFNQHRIAASKGWTIDALREEAPKEKRNGYTGENPTTTIKRSLSTLLLGREHLKIDAQKRRGNAKRMAGEMLKAIEQAESMNDDFLSALNGA